jgi:hypothetical protein
MNSTPEVIFIDEPFRVETLPLKNIYVLDNWLPSSLHHFYDTQISRANFWSKGNEVRGDSPTGLPHHQFWGGAILSGYDEDKRPLSVDDIEDKYTYFPRYLNRKLQTEFGFKWERFQYMGLNSQTQGLHGTCHQDCPPEDEWNISFLYYTNKFWEDAWGGDLRFYSTTEHGIHARDNNKEFASVKFKPNRLIMFDGRIPHGADAPTTKARYVDRKSVVVRGDEVRLVDKEEFYDANDRLSHI